MGLESNLDNSRNLVSYSDFIPSKKMHCILPTSHPWRFSIVQHPFLELSGSDSSNISPSKLQLGFLKLNLPVIYGCFQKYGYPQIIHFNRVFHYSPSFLGYPYFWKHPYFKPSYYFAGLVAEPPIRKILVKLEIFPK